MTQPRGTLIIIGGHEERTREGDRAILAEVASRAGGHKLLVVVTVASETHADWGEDYVRVFGELGVHNPRVLSLRSRKEAQDEQVVGQLAVEAVVISTGVDQLRITLPLWFVVCERHQFV